MAFRDVITIDVQGGKGGDGGLSFLRLKYIPKGGPDGGHGGTGGSVLLRAIDDVSSLGRLVGRRQFRAPVGQQGEGRNRAGAAGQDLTVDVPVGTVARDLDTGEVVADLLEVGETAVVARGGLGGRGNTAFASSVRRAPRFAEYGTPGERRRLQLELRTIADVGLVGYPNAGKSSLLAALSNSKPEIAAYPFTTLSPNLGVVFHDGGHERLTIADIPGIIEGAHLGKGLGLDFLRHISRTRLLIYVLDASDEPAETFAALQHELTQYDPELLERPAVILLNKVDLFGGDVELLGGTTDELTGSGLPVFLVSALEGEGLPEVQEALFALLPPKPVVVSEVKRKVTVRPIEVRRDLTGEGWVVTGSELEDLVARFDSTNAEAVAYLQGHFERLGVHQLLRRAGASTGEEVDIAGAVFDYFDETTPAGSRDADRDVGEAEALDDNGEDEAGSLDDNDGDEAGTPDDNDGAEDGRY